LRNEPPDEGTSDPDENRNYDPTRIIARHDQLAKRTGDQSDYDPDHDARYHFSLSIPSWACREAYRYRKREYMGGV